MAVESADLEPTPRVRWSSLRPHFLNEWEAGQHVAIIGPTRSGKSHLALELVNARAERRNAHVVVFASKQRDLTLTRMRWPIIQAWPPDYEHREFHRVILWPPYAPPSRAITRRPVFVEALDEIMSEGGWTVYLDEAIYFVEQLRLRSNLDEYWNQAASGDLTVVAASQGISWVPKPMLSQQQWLFTFRITDEEVCRDVARVAGDRIRFAPIIKGLDRYEFLLVRTRTGEAYISKVGT